MAPWGFLSPVKTICLRLEHTYSAWTAIVVAFGSYASDLVTTDTNGQVDAFVRPVR